MTHTVFRRDDGYVRHDFEWYGFGHHDGWRPTLGRVNHFWVNSYRRCPRAFRFRLVHCCGYIREHGPRKHLIFSGSMVEPYTSWFLRVGRFYVGGHSPKWLQRLEARQFAKRFEAEYDGTEDDGSEE